MLPFVTLDERLAEAARREGFVVVPWSARRSARSDPIRSGAACGVFGRHHLYDTGAGRAPARQ